MLEVEFTGQHGRTATGSGRNGRRISFRRHRSDILLLSRTTYKCSVLSNTRNTGYIAWQQSPHECYKLQ